MCTPCVVSDPGFRPLLHSALCAQCILQPARLHCGVHSKEVSVGHTHSVPDGALLIPKCQRSILPCCFTIHTKARRHAASCKEEEDVQGKDEEPAAVSCKPLTGSSPRLTCTVCAASSYCRDPLDIVVFSLSALLIKWRLTSNCLGSNVRTCCFISEAVSHHQRHLPYLTHV